MHIAKQTQDSQLFAGFLTALNQFAHSISKGDQIKQIVIGASILSFRIKEDYILVIKQKGVHPSVLKKITDNIMQKFFLLYGSKLENFTGAIDIFCGFDTHVEEILKKDYTVEEDIVEVELIGQDFKEYLSKNTELEIMDDSTQEEVLCKICLMEIIDGIDDVRYCRNRHPVHEECYKQWTSHSTKCPFCGADYPAEKFSDINGITLI